MNVVIRLSSFILVCIGVQILWNGVRFCCDDRPLNPAKSRSSCRRKLVEAPAFRAVSLV